MFRKTIFILLLIITNALAYGQTLTYTFIDPCTKDVTYFTVPATGTVIFFLNQSRTFTSADVSNGAFGSWVNQVYADYRKVSPCGVQQGQVTQNQITSQIIGNTVQSVVSSIMSSAQSSAVSGTGGTDAASKGNSGSDNKKNNQNGNNNNNNSGNSNSNTSGNSNNNGSSTTSSGNTSTGQGGGNSNSTGSTGGGSGNNNNTGTGGSGNGSSTTTSSQPTQTSNTTTSSTNSQTGEKSEVAATTTMNVDAHNGDSGGGDNSSSGGGGSKGGGKGGGKKGGAKVNPVLVSSDLTNAQNLDKTFTPILNLGMSKSSMTGMNSWGTTAMIWFNFKQFALSSKYTMIHFSKSGKLKWVHNLNLTGVYSYGNVLGFIGYSGILNAGKWGVTGFNISVAGTLVAEDKNTFFSPSITAFYTKPFIASKRLTISPELYVISTPLIYSSKEKVTTTDRTFSGFVGSGFDYQLTKRFKFNFNYKANLSTNPSFPILSFFLIGSKVNL